MTIALKGASIVVTRPKDQAAALCGLIAARGGKPLAFPTLAINSVTPEDRLVDDALRGDWLIFTSTNAVDFARPVFGGKMPAAGGPRIAVVGPATAEAVRLSGWSVDCMPVSEFSSEGLLAEPALQNVAGSVFTIVRGVGGRQTLATALVERGASVRFLEVYRRCCPDEDPSRLMAELHDVESAVVTITSVEALVNLLTLVGEASATILKQARLLVVSNRIKQAAIDLGFQRINVSGAPTDEAIVETLTTILNGEGCGGRH